MNYKKQYNCQKSTAKGRNIDWHFTYETWLAWWGTDIINRGRKTGQLVMARIGDQGSYDPNNVLKATCNQNAGMINRDLSNHKRSNTLKGRILSAVTIEKMSQSKIGKQQTTETRDKISAKLKGREAPNKGKRMSEEFRQQKRDWWAKNKEGKL
jgi:hypothetical protein